MGKIFMKDQVDAKEKMKKIKRGGLCMFYAYPDGIIITGGALTK